MLDMQNRGRWFLSLLQTILRTSVVPPGMNKITFLPSQKNLTDTTDFPYMFVQLNKPNSEYEQQRTTSGRRIVKGTQGFYVCAGMKTDNGLNTLIDDALSDLEDSIEGAFMAAQLPGNPFTYQQSFNTLANSGLSTYPHTVAINEIMFPTGEGARYVVPPPVSSMSEILLSGEIVFNQTPFAGQL